jgi:hypothetical protein
MRPGEWGFPRISLLKLSEKGFEQRSEREFDWFTEGKMDRNISCQRSVRLSRRRLPDFSDSFSRQDSAIR